MYKLFKKIMIKTSFRATHNWPEASTYAGEEVKFLEDRHRHTFHVKAELAVTDSDREVEFFVFQHQVDQVIKLLYSDSADGLVYNLGRRSCETIAEDIINQLRSKHGYKGPLTVEVWEDNEVGGQVTSYAED
jgi:hypothetical protein